MTSMAKLGLADRARTPHHSPRATSPAVVSKILYLRQNYHFGAYRIAAYLLRFSPDRDCPIVRAPNPGQKRHGPAAGQSESTGHTVSAGSATRRPNPGTRLQMDVKFLERIPGTREASLSVHRNRRLYAHPSPESLRSVQSAHGYPVP